MIYFVDISYSESQALSPQTVCPARTGVPTCTVNASQSILETCSYYWTLNTTGQVVDMNDLGSLSGIFVCNAECQVRGRTCLVSPRTVNISQNCQGFTIL